MKITGMTWRRAVWEWLDLNADLGPLGEMGPDKSLLELHNFDMDTFGKPQPIAKKGLFLENHYTFHYKNLSSSKIFAHQPFKQVVFTSTEIGMLVLAQNPLLMTKFSISFYWVLLEH